MPIRSSTASPSDDRLHRRSQRALRGRADLLGAAVRPVDVPRPRRAAGRSRQAAGSGQAGRDARGRGPACARGQLRRLRGLWRAVCSGGAPLRTLEDGADRGRAAPADRVGREQRPARHAADTRGVGSRLVQRGLAQELGGEIKLNFAAAGLFCVITFPVGGTAVPEAGGAAIPAAPCP